ncbi:Flagellar L-ring protein FlgH [hydrothermal vent metagenome]|uniref:Flagellar L-ring protein FlgH n=1 Tax=hydrothermal vent metagenome TaxID=652676 RepID=A0A3B0SXP4_9ZZZZ
MKKWLLTSVLALSVTGCGTFDRIRNIGKAPELSPIQNPAQVYGQRPVSMPMPLPEAKSTYPNSLWRAGSRTFFNDQRANNVGDILTVAIDISDSANVKNSTERSRTSAEDSDLTNFFGLENNLGGIAPGSLTSFGSTSGNKGSGSVVRSEKVSLTVAAVVTQVLPNGNMIIAGRQEVRINHEARDLLISGMVRPQDISSSNVIAHTQIAEARISYGGRGVISDTQNPRYGQELYNIIFPF